MRWTVLARWISLRHFVRSPLRTVLVVLGIALGVAMLVATTSVNASIRGAFMEAVQRVVGPTDLIVTGGEVGVPEDLVVALAHVPGVAHAAGMLEINTRVVGNASRGLGPLLVLGVDFLGDRTFLPFRTESEEDPADGALELVNDPRAILIAKHLADALSIEPGGTVSVLTPEGPKELRVRGILADEGPAASFGGRIAVMFVEAAKDAFGRGDHVDRIDLAIDEGADLAAVEARAKEIVGARGSVERPKGRAQHLSAILVPLEAGIQVAGFIALLVGMFLIYNAVSIATAQRRREIGVLRALGALRRQIIRMFLAEAVLLAILGSAIGLFIAQFIAQIAVAQVSPAVNRVYLPIQPSRPALGLDLAIAGFVLGIATTIVAAYLPARGGAEVDPIDAMQPVRERRSSEGIRHGRLAIGGVASLAPAAIAAALGSLWSGLAAIGVVIAGVALLVPTLVLGLASLSRRIFELAAGVPGRIAVENAVRSIHRSALSVAASVTAGSWGRSLEDSILRWVDETFAADLTVTNGSPLPDQQNMPFRSEALQAIASVPGVRQISPIRIITHPIAGVRILLASQSSGALFGGMKAKGLAYRLASGVPPDGDDYERAPYAMLSENAAKRLGVKAGDRLRLETPTGAHEAEVRSIVVDYSSDAGAAYIDRRWYASWFEDPLVDAADVFLEPGADASRIADEIRRRLGAQESLFVSTSADVKREVQGVVLDSVAILRSTDVVAIVVALLGVIGSMLAAVIDRVREIGLLRAIGATRRQVATSIAVEAGFLGLAASLIGIAAGVPMGVIFVSVVARAATGWRLDYHFPFVFALEVGLSMTFTAAIAGLLPGRVAARIDVKDALQYD
jgi:putative ABC transport system permease protein